MTTPADELRDALAREVDAGLAAAEYREAQHPRGPGGQWVTLDWDSADKLVAEEFQPAQMDAARVKHPRSGYMVETGIERRVHHPPDSQHGNESLGIEGPAEFDLLDYGNPLNPEHRSTVYPQKVGTEPIPHVYRGMTEAEWEQAQARGYIQSDQRGTISPLEGTNAAADPRSAISYLPYEPGRSRVAKIRVDPAEKWFTIHADQYLRTREKIPLSRVEHVVEFERTPRIPGKGHELRARRTRPEAQAGGPEPQTWIWVEPEPEAEAG